MFIQGERNVHTTQPLVSVVIVNFNGGEMLIRCLKSVFDSKYEPIEIILVDNKSTDDSVAIAEKLFGERQNFKVVKLSRNVGFAQGNNVGVKYCRGKYIVFLNNDTIVDPLWLDRVVEVMERDSNIGAVQSKLLQLGNPRLLDSAGDFIDSYCLSFKRGYGEEDRGQYDQIEEIFSARGAAMTVRADVLRDVGLFDSALFGSCEDIDLCWRIWLRGYRVLYVPQSIVYHVGGATKKKLNHSFITFHQTRNVLIMSLKNKDMMELILHPSIIPTIGAMILDIIKRRNPKLFTARLKAIVFFLKEMRRIYRKRLRVQKMKKHKIEKIILKSNLTAIILNFLYSLKFGSEKAHRLYFSLLMTKHSKGNPRTMT